VLSGSATSPRNKALLTFDWAAGTPAVPVTFSATVRSDRVMLRALHEHLVRINAKWNRGEGVALLVESNTAYGHAAGALSATPETHTADADDPFPLALRLPFPMHISRLRAQAESTRASPPTLRGPARVALGLGNSGPTTDVLPSMSPEPTAASVDTMLSQILATIRREEYGAIGILSTDKRDHLFLAERIVRESPNALLFTTEADLIYTHPDYKAFVRGAIVASTYPMFNGTQPLTAPHLGAAGRQQFPTMAAQGTYNALLKLLERDDLLLDYLPPRCVPGDARRRTETECSGPPVWIEVVGQNGIWPIGVHAVSEKEYTAPLNWKKQVASVSERTLGSSRLVHGSEDLTRHALLHVSPWLRLAFVVIMLGLLVHGIAYLAELGLWRTLTQRWIPALERGARRVRLREFGQAMRYVACLRLLQIDVADRSGAEGARGLRQEHRLFLLIGFTIVWFVALWSMRLFRIWGGEEVVTFAPSGITGINAGGSWGIPMVWLFVYLGLFAVLVGECVNAMGVRRAAAPDGWLPGALVTAAALVITFFAVSNVAGFIGSESWLDPDAAGLLFARTVNPSNWVSPAVPMIVLSGIIYWWSVWNIRHLLRGGWIYRAESAILDLLSGRERQLATQIVDTLTSPWRCQAWWTLGIPFGLLLSFWIYVPNWYTPDGHFFDGFLWWGSLLALFLVAHSLSQTVHLWLLVRRVLRHLFTLSMRDAFPVVAKQPLNWRLSLAPPLLTELTPMARKVRDLRLELRRLIGASTDPEHPTGQPFDERRRTTLPPAVGQVAGDPATAHTLRVRHQETDPMARELAVELPDVLVEEASGNASLPYFESRTWERLVRVSDTLLPVLIHGFWRRASHTGHTKLDDWYHNAEVLVGMQVAFILRDLVSRLVSGMTVSIGGAVLALAAHLFYSFPGRSAMLAFDWIVLALAVGGAVGMLVTLERDTVLSQLWSTTPGRVNWTGGFVYRLGLYGMVPVVTLFVWQFPEVGGTLFSWMEPLQKAIP
jgi:hypothetical protein